LEKILSEFLNAGVTEVEIDTLEHSKDKTLTTKGLYEIRDSFFFFISCSFKILFHFIASIRVFAWNTELLENLAYGELSWWYNLVQGIPQLGLNWLLRRLSDPLSIWLFFIYYECRLKCKKIYVISIDALLSRRCYRFHGFTQRVSGRRNFGIDCHLALSAFQVFYLRCSQDKRESEKAGGFI